MKTQEKILWAGRISLFIIFFWFGLLKILVLSPAEGLIKHLHEITLARFISADHFMLLLGLMECIIGILWLLPNYTKLAFIIFSAQMFSTFLPLVFLPQDAWNGVALSLTGQYIVKNIALIALATMIYYSSVEERESQKARHVVVV